MLGLQANLFSGSGIMDTEGFDFDHAAGTLTNDEQRAADSKLNVSFSKMAVLDQLLTEGGLVHKKHPKVKEAEKLHLEMHEWEEDSKFVVIEPAGRNIYREVDFVRIIIPGNRDNINERALTPDDKLRFADRYARWKKGEDENLGTPVKEIPFINAAQREELAFFGIHSAEQLLSASDQVTQKFLGFRALQQKVQRWQEALAGDGTKNIERALAEKDAELQGMKQAIAELQAQLASAGAHPQAESPRQQPARSGK